MKKFLSTFALLAGLGFTFAQQTQVTLPDKARAAAIQSTKNKTNDSKAKRQKTNKEIKKKTVEDKENKNANRTNETLKGYKLKKDGTPDKRFKSNRRLKKDGTPDKRYKVNR
ncbi:MAG: hypothetical protein FDW93_03320 [Bergeyella sp.]|nr:hypothetical protein [Bergeyella sp.]